MSYSIEILEWFSRYSKRNLRLFEATLTEAEDLNSGNNGPPVFMYTAKKNKPPRPNRPLSFDEKTIAEHPYAAVRQLFNNMHNVQIGSNFENAQPTDLGGGKTLWVWKSKGDSTNQDNVEEQKPEKQLPANDFHSRDMEIGRGLEYNDLSLFVSQSLVNQLIENVNNSEIGFLDRFKKLKKLVEKLYSKSTWGEDKIPKLWKRKTKPNAAHRELYNEPPELFLERIRTVVTKKLSQCEVITSDGSEATPEERAKMIESAMAHVARITSERQLDQEAAYFYKENVKIMSAGSSDRLIIYSEPDENGRRISISLPHTTAEVRALFSDVLVSKINDSLPDDQQITELRSITSSEAYSAAFGVLMEKIHTTFINRNNAMEEVKKCKPGSDFRKKLEKYCAHFDAKLEELNNELRKTAIGLLEKASKLTHLITEEKAIAGDSELVESLSQAISEVSELFKRNFISEIEEIERKNRDNPEEIKKQKQALIKSLAQRVVTETSRYQRDLNDDGEKNVLDGVVLTLMAGEDYKYGSRRQDVHYFSVNKENAEAISAHHKTKSEIININDTERLKQLIPDDNDREYLIQRAKNEGSQEIYLNKKSLKNSMSERFEIKLATDSAKHHEVRTDVIISLLDEINENGEIILSPKSEQARKAYNDYIVRVSKGKSLPLTDKEFKEMIETFRSRVGKHIKNPTDMKKALEESKRRSRIIKDFSDRDFDTKTETQNGKEVITADLTHVGEILKKELGVDLDDPILKELRGAVSSVLKKKPPPTQKQLKILLQRATLALVNKSAVDKIKSGDAQEANVLIAEMYSRGMSAENTGVISFQNFHHQEAGLVAHNDLLDGACEVISDVASGKEGKSEIRATETGLTFDSGDGSVTMRTDYSSGNNGSTIIHVDHKHIRKKAHKIKTYKTAKPTVRGSEENED